MYKIIIHLRADGTTLRLQSDHVKNRALQFVFLFGNYMYFAPPSVSVVSEIMNKIARKSIVFGKIRRIGKPLNLTPPNLQKHRIGEVIAFACENPVRQHTTSWAGVIKHAMNFRNWK